MKQETRERSKKETQDRERRGGHAMPLSAGSIAERRATWADIAVFIVVGGVFAAVGAMIARRRGPAGPPPLAFPPIHERRLPLWLDITIANIGAFVMGVLAIEACEHKAFLGHCLFGAAAAVIKSI